jgi:hypothetical protein
MENYASLVNLISFYKTINVNHVVPIVCSVIIHQIVLNVRNWVFFYLKVHAKHVILTVFNALDRLSIIVRFVKMNIN